MISWSRIAILQQSNVSCRLPCSCDDRSAEVEHEDIGADWRLAAASRGSESGDRRRTEANRIGVLDSKAVSENDGCLLLLISSRKSSISIRCLRIISRKSKDGRKSRWKLYLLSSLWASIYRPVLQRDGISMTTHRARPCELTKAFPPVYLLFQDQ